jgi:hypothetical protein
MLVPAVLLVYQILPQISAVVLSLRWGRTQETQVPHLWGKLDLNVGRFSHALAQSDPR